jgi:hypothetical protein
MRKQIELGSFPKLSWQIALPRNVDAFPMVGDGFAERLIWVLNLGLHLRKIRSKFDETAQSLQSTRLRSCTN